MQFLYMPSFIQKQMISNQMGSKIRAIYYKSFPWNRPFRVGLDYLLTWPWPRSLRNPNGCQSVAHGDLWTRGTQLWMLKPAWFKSNLVCFTNPKASEIFKIFSWLHLGDCGFHFLVVGDVFFWKKMGCVGDVPLGSSHSGDGRNHTPSHSPLKKSWNLKITNWKWHFWGSSY